MVSLQNLIEEVSTGDDKIVDELENNKELLVDIKELLQAQLNFSKDLAERERLAFENREFSTAESLAESGRNISDASERGSATGSLSDMTNSILSGIGPLSMSRIGGGLTKLLRGGLLTALAVGYGEQIGRFLQENIEDIMTDVGFQEEVAKKWSDTIGKYTPSTAVGAAIGSIFGPRGTILGGLLGAASEYYQIPEFYNQLKNAVSDEEKERIRNEFIDQFTDNPGETAALATVIGGILFGVKGAIIMGLSAFLFTALGLERLTTPEGREQFQNDLKERLLFDLSGGFLGQPGSQGDAAASDVVTQVARHGAQRVVRSGLAMQGAEAGDQYLTRRARRQASQRAAHEAAEAAAAPVTRQVASGILDASGRPIMTEVVEQAAETTVRQGAETAAREIAQNGIQAALKKAPFGVGFLMSIPFAIAEAREGDYTGASLEMAAGISSIFPGFGTAASYGFTGANIAKDVFSGDDSVPEMNRGTLGTFGKLFQDFGAGTPVVLHGKEAVITPEQYTTLIKPDVSTNEISNISRSVASSSSVVAVQPVINNFNNVDNSTNVQGGRSGSAPAQLPAGAPKDYDRSLMG